MQLSPGDRFQEGSCVLFFVDSSAQHCAYLRKMRTRDLGACSLRQGRQRLYRANFWLWRPASGGPSVELATNRFLDHAKQVAGRVAYRACTASRCPFVQDDLTLAWFDLLKGRESPRLLLTLKTLETLWQA